MSRSSLVPALPSDFSKSAYWESFFQKRVQAFEWYGTYYDLCGIIHRYIKVTDHTLVAGCGNSELSENMYDAGFKMITNIDISQVVVDQMNKRKGNRDFMKYLTMDLTNLEFDDESFSVIMDKGTLDAIMSDDSAGSNEKTDQIFREYFRVLKNGGRYLCITLAQDFILKKVLEYFPNNGWLVRLHKVAVSNSKSNLPVFAFVMTKFKNLPKKILEVCTDDTFTPLRVDQEREVADFVVSQQQYAALTSNLNREIDPTRDNPPIQLYSTTNSAFPRFIIYLVDKSSFKPNCKFAVFIVPQGSESSMTFRTHERRKRVACQTPFQRVLFVMLHSRHEYGSQAEIQEELNSIVMDFAPPGVSATDEVPYLSTNTGDMEHRVVQFEGENSITGKYLVEDFTKETENWYRHLLLKGDQNFVVTEIRLKKAPVAHGKKSGKRKRETNLVPDHSYLAPGYERPILAGFLLKFSPQDEFRAMMLGLGGGAMSSYILHNFRNCTLTAVELDPDIAKVAQEWFGVPKGGEGSQFQLHVTDGISFVHEESSKIEKSSSDAEKYDIVVVDMGGKESTPGIALPIIEAAEHTYMKAISRILKPTGFMILNLLCWNDGTRSKVMYNLRRNFKIVAKARCDAFYNEVLYCFKQKPNVQTSSSSSKSKKKRKKQSKSKENHGKNENGPEKVQDTEKIEVEISELSLSSTTTQNQDSVVPSCGKNNSEVKASGSYGDMSILDEKFVPPPAKVPIRLEKYDSDWFLHWKEKAAAWDKQYNEKMNFSDLVTDIVIEREVNYYEPDISDPS